MSTITDSPRGTCALGGVNATITALERVIPIYHSGPGCCMQNSAGEAGQSGGRSPYQVGSVSTPCTNMIERDIVFGALDRLRETTEGALEIYDADAFFLLSGCTSGIIGDDVGSIAKEFQERGEAVYAIESPGFLGESYRGFELAFEAFLDQIVKPADEHEPDLVNLLGIMPYHNPFWQGNIEELTRILERLGLRVNTFFTRHQGIEDIRTSSRAALNVIVSPWLLRSAEEQYQERFGVPSLRWPGPPVGATDTTAFVRAVGETLHLDHTLVERVIAEEEDYVYSYLATTPEGLSWKRFAIVGDAATVVGVTRFLANDYSLTPAVAIVTDPMFRDDDKAAIARQLTTLEYAQPPKVVFTTDQWEISQELRLHDDVTLLIGSTNDRESAQESDAQYVPISYPVTDRLVFNRSIIGYRGSLTLIEDIFTDL